MQISYAGAHSHAHGPSMGRVRTRVGEVRGWRGACPTLHIRTLYSEACAHAVSRRFATLLARGGARFNGNGVLDQSWPLGHHHPRGIVLPLAVAPHSPPHSSPRTLAHGVQGGMATINVSRIAGCSSLMAFNANATWGRHCFRNSTKSPNGGMLESRQVPTISLEGAIRLTPAALPIAKLKLDVQGLDLELLRSTRAEALRRVQSVELEVVKKGCATLYVGQPTHQIVEEFLRSRGFMPKYFRWHGHIKCEGTAYFERASPTVEAAQAAPL